MTKSRDLLSKIESRKVPKSEPIDMRNMIKALIEDIEELNDKIEYIEESIEEIEDYVNGVEKNLEELIVGRRGKLAKKLGLKTLDKFE